MKHNNISLFIPHNGCPNKCSFCNQHIISGAEKSPTACDVYEICKKALSEVRSPENTEIAFFGGSFTAIPRKYMLQLLETAYEFVGEGKFHGIRVSTRPDCIDREVLDILRQYGVTAIELGAQSMSDKVLTANRRGHTSDDVYKASSLIREYGFELGLQMMVGLYKSCLDDEFHTMESFINIRPDTVRIYPVVILKGTELADLYESGEYIPIQKHESMQAVISMVAVMLKSFEENGIEVIKCGLHASEFVEKDMTGGFYHPAFRELCEGYIYRNEIDKIICNKLNISKDFKLAEKKYFIFAVRPSCISKAVGHKKSNIQYFSEKNIYIKFVGDESINKYCAELRG